MRLKLLDIHLLQEIRLVSKHYELIWQSNGSSCFIFIDEAGISFVPKNKKCRGFVGVTPLTLRNLQFDRISVVAAVITIYIYPRLWSNIPME